MINDLRELTEKVNTFVNYVVKTACEETTSGQYYVSVEDACKAAGMVVEDFLEHKDIIMNEFLSRNEVLDFDYRGISADLDIDCTLNYCPNYEWCEGDEEIFGSYAEFEKREVLPVGQPLSLTRLAEIGVNAISASKNNLNDLVVQFAKLWGMSTANARDDEHSYLELEAYDSAELTVLLLKWAEEYLASDCDDTVEFFEEKVAQLFSPHNDRAKVPVGSITYHTSHETIEYYDNDAFIKAYKKEVYYTGPMGCTPKVLNDDLHLQYEIAKIQYGEYCEEIEPFEQWKEKILSVRKEPLDSVILSCENVSKKADVVDINQYRNSKEER